MEIKRSENEIVIKINKEDRVFEELNVLKDISRFIEYSFDLEIAVNGYDSGEMPCYECLDLYQENTQDITKKKIKEEKEECMKVIESCLKGILEVAGYEYTTAFMMEDGYASIDDSDNIHLMQLFFERLKYLTSIEKRKEDK